MQEQTLKFIDKYGFNTEKYDFEALLQEFLNEMQKGLDKESSLQMIPSFIKFGSIKKETPVCVLDAGGTNLRAARAQITKDGEFELLAPIKKVHMPGTKETCSKEEFFDILCNLCKDYVKSGESIAFSFSFPATIMPDLDAEVIVIDKEVKLFGMQGVLVGRELKKALENCGIFVKEVIILNDSVATCLAGIAEGEGKFDTFTGTIIGTGLNNCYFEKCKNIGKLNEKSGTMIINTESGSYANVPLNEIDIKYDNTLTYPGRQNAEIQISGGFLGGLFTMVLERANEEGLIHIKYPFETETKDIDDLLRGKKGVIAENLKKADVLKVKELAKAFVKRAAFFSAVHICAIAKKSGGKKICMTMEGSTYYNLCGFKQEADRVVLEYLNKNGVEIEIKDIDNAVIKGCTISALMR